MLGGRPEPPGFRRGGGAPQRAAKAQAAPARDPPRGARLAPRLDAACPNPEEHSLRIDTPRLPPLADDEIDAETRARFGDAPMLNIFRTLAHHPKLMKRWLVFGNHVLARNSLPERERELVILRTGWLCRAEYEWTQHVAIAKRCGLGDDDIARIAQGPDAGGLADFDRVLLRAVDELRSDAFLSDGTWKALAQRYDTTQLLDLIFTVGQYQLVSMALNSLGVQLEPGTPRLDLRP